METELNAGDHFDLPPHQRPPGLQRSLQRPDRDRNVEPDGRYQLGLGNTNITTIIDTRTDSVLGGVGGDIFMYVRVKPSVRFTRNYQIVLETCDEYS